MRTANKTLELPCRTKSVTPDHGLGRQQPALAVVNPAEGSASSLTLETSDAASLVEPAFHIQVQLVACDPAGNTAGQHWATVLFNAPPQIHPLQTLVGLQAASQRQPLPAHPSAAGFDPSEEGLLGGGQGCLLLEAYGSSMARLLTLRSTLAREQLHRGVAGCVGYVAEAHTAAVGASKAHLKRPAHPPSQPLRPFHQLPLQWVSDHWKAGEYQVMHSFEGHTSGNAMQASPRESMTE
jgi:hypothetical protein